MPIRSISSTSDQPARIEPLENCRHGEHAKLGHDQFDRERETVEPLDQAYHVVDVVGGQFEIRSNRGRPIDEEAHRRQLRRRRDVPLDGFLRGERSDRELLLSGNAQRYA
jgi:hypothetical protein